jgi:soluble lytic murein transglycosylase-like protein
MGLVLPVLRVIQPSDIVIANFNSPNIQPNILSSADSVSSPNSSPHPSPEHIKLAEILNKFDKRRTPGTWTGRPLIRPGGCVETSLTAKKFAQAACGIKAGKDDTMIHLVPKSPSSDNVKGSRIEKLQELFDQGKIQVGDVLSFTTQANLNLDHATLANGGRGTNNHAATVTATKNPKTGKYKIGLIDNINSGEQNSLTSEEFTKSFASYSPIIYAVGRPNYGLKNINNTPNPNPNLANPDLDKIAGAMESELQKRDPGFLANLKQSGLSMNAVVKIAAKIGVNPTFLLESVKIESGGIQAALSAVGAGSLAQIMPKTAAAIIKKHPHLANYKTNAESALEISALYKKEIALQRGWTKEDLIGTKKTASQYAEVVADYNSGPHAKKSLIQIKGQSLTIAGFSETINHAKKFLAQGVEGLWGGEAMRNSLNKAFEIALGNSSGNAVKHLA